MERERDKRGVSGFNSWYEKYQDQLTGSKKPSRKFNNDSYIRIKEAGYINKVILCLNKKDLFIASEKGVFISKILDNYKLSQPTDERYLTGQLIS